MNSLGGREWELYNIGGSTEYDNLLINKDIDNYFNDIINKPTVQSNSNQIKSNGGLQKFYSDYVEHNLIFIVVLIGIIIFLIIRYYAKDLDTFDTNSSINDNKGENQKERSYKQNEKFKTKSRKLEIEKLKLINYKRELDKEKQQILSIIDELSNINDYENSKMNITIDDPYINSNMNINYIKDNQDINKMYSNNYNDVINKIGYSNYNSQFESRTLPHNHNKNNITNYKDDEISNYYDINNIKNDETNKIDGLYIEPPFM
jgi:hypothetical protein